jgi:methylated-DNA-[protein]-cysteine S-methyltransferase
LRWRIIAYYEGRKPLANKPPHLYTAKRHYIAKRCGGKKYESIKIFEFKKLMPFAKKVYKAVLSIPIGEVRSYKWVAQKIGSPGATRAVGQILKHNPWPLIIPCHRVICADGKLGGYARGEKKKKALLDLEKQIREDVV